MTAVELDKGQPCGERTLHPPRRTRRLHWPTLEERDHSTRERATFSMTIREAQVRL